MPCGRKGCIPCLTLAYAPYILQKLGCVHGCKLEQAGYHASQGRQSFPSACGVSLNMREQTMSTPTKHRVRQVQKSIPSPILVNCVEDYIAECIAKGLKPRTVENHKLALKHLVQCVPSELTWHTVPSVRRAVASLRSRSYADASVSMYLRSWRAFLHFCLAERLIQDDLAASIKPPKTEPRREVILSVTDIHALIDSTRAGLNPERDEAILTVMYDCGLRAGEVCALQVRHVDMGSRTLTVPSGKTGGRSVPIGRITAKADNVPGRV